MVAQRQKALSPGSDTPSARRPGEPAGFALPSLPHPAFPPSPGLAPPPDTALPPPTLPPIPNRPQQRRTTPACRRTARPIPVLFPFLFLQRHCKSVFHLLFGSSCIFTLQLMNQTVALYLHRGRTCHPSPSKTVQPSITRIGERA